MTLLTPSSTAATPGGAVGNPATPVAEIATVPLDGILADYPGVVVSTTPLQDGNTIDWNLDT